MCVLLVWSFSDLSFSQTLAERNDEPKERANAFSLYGGMGVSLASDPHLVDYINVLVDPSQRVADFATDVEFFGGAEIPVDDEWAAVFEYSYLFKSYNLPTYGNGTYTIFYSLHLPVAMAQYVIPGKGYFVKLGGGLGYHTGLIEQKTTLYPTDITYAAHGVGVKLNAVGQTAFDEHLYAYIGGTLRWEFLGDVKDASGNTLQYHSQTASLSMFVVGLAFGLTYYF